MSLRLFSRHDDVRLNVCYIRVWPGTVTASALDFLHVAFEFEIPKRADDYTKSMKDICQMTLRSIYYEFASR